MAMSLPPNAGRGERTPHPHRRRWWLGPAVGYGRFPAPQTGGGVTPPPPRTEVGGGWAPPWGTATPGSRPSRGVVFRLRRRCRCRRAGVRRVGAVRVLGWRRLRRHVVVGLF